MIRVRFHSEYSLSNFCFYWIRDTVGNQIKCQQKTLSMKVTLYNSWQDADWVNWARNRYSILRSYGRNCLTGDKNKWLMRDFFSSGHSSSGHLPQNITHNTCWIFSVSAPPPPSMLCAPQLQSTCHYIISHDIKYGRCVWGAQILCAY